MPPRTELVRNWIEDNRKLKAEGKPPISWDDWYKQKFGSIPEFLKGAEELPVEFQERPFHIKENSEPIASKDLLQQTFDFLGLDESRVQGKQKIKIENQKKVIMMCYQWKRGYYHQWIDWLSIPLGLSTRKVREDYLDPLISKGIIHRNGNNEMRFIGVPKTKGDREDEV